MLDIGFSTIIRVNLFRQLEKRGIITYVINLCVFACICYIITMDKITAEQQVAIKKTSDVRLVSKLTNAGVVAGKKSKKWVDQP